MSAHDRLVSFLLRVGIAVVFLYAAVASFLDPTAWIGFLPIFMRKLIPAEQLLMILSVYEVLLALWLLSGKKVFWAGLLASATLIGIILPNIGAMDIIFRDVGILFAALAFSVLHFKR